MASKKSAKNTLKEAVTLSYKLQRFVSYADFFNRVPLFISLQVSNQSSETIDDIDVVIENASGLLLPFSKHLEHLPFESTVEIATEDVLSPLYLTEISEITVQPVTIKALSGATVIVEERAEVTVLPFDYWSGRSGNAELLSCFSRPKIADCLRVLSEAQEQLKKWGIACEWRGYAEGDKNKIRQIAAAIFSVLKKNSIEKSAAEFQYEDPMPVGDITKILKTRVGTSFELTLFIVSCLECANLHPVIVVGEKSVSCGVWLYDNCFLDSVSDDTVLMQKYISGGINNISGFDVEDVFSGRNVNFTASEKHFAQNSTADISIRSSM